MQEFRVNKMVKKAQMPVKNIIILTALVLVIFLIVGGVVWYFVGEKLVIAGGEEVTQTTPAGDVEEFIQTFGPVSQEEISQRLLRDKMLLDSAIKNNGLNATEVYDEINQAGQKALQDLSKNLNITEEQAAQLIIIIEEQRKQYPTLESKTAYEMVAIDFMDFEEKVETEVMLPEVFMGSLPLSNAQVAFVLKGESLKSFPEIYEEVTGEKLQGENVTDINLMEQILAYNYEILNTTALEFERTSCTIGDEKGVVLRADYLISNEKKINYSVDRVIYGPNGIMIYDLSKENYIEKYSNNYTPETYIIKDVVKIPLYYLPGTYVVEYDIIDNILETKRVERVPLNCIRHLFIDQFDFILMLEDEIAVVGGNTFSPGDQVHVSFDLAGFTEDLKNESEQFQLTWRVIAQDGSVVQEIVSAPKGNLIVAQNEVLTYIGDFKLLDDIDPGDYIVFLKIKDLLHDVTIRSGKLMEVE